MGSQGKIKSVIVLDEVEEEDEEKKKLPSTECMNNVMS